MTRRTATTSCPSDILAVIDSNGERSLTRDQLQRLIAWEASQMDLTFEQAVDAAEQGTLPRTALGSDVELLLRMWEPTHTATTAWVTRGSGKGGWG